MSNMAVAAFMISTLFLGGYQVPFAPTEVLKANPQLALGIWGAILLAGGVIFGYFLLPPG